MKYQVNYIESFTGGREIKTFVEADSKEEARDLVYEGEFEDWEIVDENVFTEGIDIQSVEELTEAK